MLDRLDRLRHHAVIRRDDEDHYIRGSCAARPHGRKRCVAGRVNEGDLALRRIDTVRTDVLGDATGLAAGNASLADMVEQRCLAMVDMTHDRDDRRSRETLADDLERTLQRLLHRVGMDSLWPVSHFFDHEDCAVLIDRLVDGSHHAHAHQRLDDFARLDRHTLREFANADHIRYFYFAADELGRFEFAAVLIHLERTAGATALASALGLERELSSSTPLCCLAAAFTSALSALAALAAFIAGLRRRGRSRNRLRLGYRWRFLLLLCYQARGLGALSFFLQPQLFATALFFCLTLSLFPPDLLVRGSACLLLLANSQRLDLGLTKRPFLCLGYGLVGGLGRLGLATLDVGTLATDLDGHIAASPALTGLQGANRLAL